MNRIGTLALEQGPLKGPWNDSTEMRNLTEEPEGDVSQVGEGHTGYNPIPDQGIEGESTSRSRSSGMEPPSRSCSNTRTITEPRRRVTGPQGGLTSGDQVPILGEGPQDGKSTVPAST